jgi:hypothetical protein
MAREKSWAIVFLIVALACCPWPRPLPVPNTWQGGTVYHNPLDLLSTPQQTEEAPVEIQIEEVEYLWYEFPAEARGNIRIFWRDQPEYIPNVPIWLAHFLYPYQCKSKYKKGAPLFYKA